MDALAINVSTSSLPSYASGTFKRSSVKGASQHECRNKVGGTYSLGSFFGDWYVIPGLNCQNPVATFRIAKTMSADPTHGGGSRAITLSHTCYSPAAGNCP